MGKRETGTVHLLPDNGGEGKTGGAYIVADCDKKAIRMDIVQYRDGTSPLERDRVSFFRGEQRGKPIALDLRIQSRPAMDKIMAAAAEDGAIFRIAQKDDTGKIIKELGQGTKIYWRIKIPLNVRGKGLSQGGLYGYEFYYSGHWVKIPKDPRLI